MILNVNQFNLTKLLTGRFQICFVFYFIHLKMSSREEGGREGRRKKGRGNERGNREEGRRKKGREGMRGGREEGRRGEKRGGRQYWIILNAHLGKCKQWPKMGRREGGLVEIDQNQSGLLSALAYSISLTFSSLIIKQPQPASL